MKKSAKATKTEKTESQATSSKTKSSVKTRGKRIFAAVLLLIIALTFLASGLYAILDLTANEQLNVSTITLEASSTFTYGNSEQKLTFTEPGDKEYITITTNNSTDTVLTTSYALTLSDDSDENLPKAILVYLNDEYQGTLAELSTSTATERLEGAFTAAGSSATSATSTDTLTLELHLGADDSIYQGKTVSLTTSAYTKNADYVENIFVTTPVEFTRAVDDVNSGLLDGEAQIVLLADVTAAGNSVKAPCYVNLNGHTLDGSVTLDSSTAYLWCDGDKKNSATELSVTFNSYDSATVKEKLIAAAKEALEDGVAEGKKQSLFGENDFYIQDTTDISVSASAAVNYTLSGETITAKTVERSSVEIISVCGETIEFKVLDSETELSSSYLQNVPDVADSDDDGDISDETDVTVVTSDLFLPTAIRSEGAIIEWTSGTPDIIDDEGRIVVGKADKVNATLYAAITVNGITHTEEFNFLVSAHTNEVNFYKMVASMSPIIIYESQSTDSDGNTTGLYELPVVSGGDYDYREDYKTPSYSSIWSLKNGKIPEGEERLYAHSAYTEIFLEQITYSEVMGDSDGDGAEEETYSYIDLQSYDNSGDGGTGTGYRVYLPNPTIQTYAELTITGTFTTGDEYSSKVIIVIATGADTTVFDPAIAKVSETLAQINVLNNILTTRVENGVLSESGDFILDGTLTANNITFTITYETVDGATNADIVKKIEQNADGTYTVSLNLEKLLNVETTVPLSVTASWSGVVKEATLYFTVPAAVHTEDLGNATIFNSIKYQVYQQLPDVEQNSLSSAFVESGSTVTNKTADYILLRDIVGDKEYNDAYPWYAENKNPYEYTGYDTTNVYAGCEELWFYTADNSTNYTDYAARDFAALINWATGKTANALASSVVTNTTALGDYASTKSDGKEYMTDDEVAVLKTYYMNAANATEDEWDAIWAQVAERAAGYVMTNGSAVETLAASLITAASSGSTLYFKYTGVMEWATNFKDNTYNTHEKNTEYTTGISGNPEFIKYNLVFSTDSKAPESTIYVTWSKSTASGYGTAAKNESEQAYKYIGTIGGVKWYYYTTNLGDAKYSRYNILGYSTDITATTTKGDSSTAITVETLYDTKITNYLDDDTSYITPGEAEVIFSFILSNTGVDGFKSYVETFYASAIIPTYFTDEGVELLMQSFYEKSGISVGTESGFTTALVSTGNGSNSGLDVTTEVSKAPAVTNLDQLSSGLSYFTALTQIYVQGTDDLPAFLSEYGLTTSLSTARKTADGIKTLVLEHVADNYVEFSLSNIKYFESLKQIDVSDNVGVTNVNPLVNYLSDNYTYVDISAVSVEDEFYDFVLKNSHATVYYGASHTSGNSSAGTISSLSELESLIAENMYLATQVTTKDGTATDTVYWRIENGNKITYVSAAADSSSLKTVDSADTMQSLISPYYYVASESGFTYGGTTYKQGTVLRFSYNSDGTYSVGETVMTEVSNGIPSTIETDAEPTTEDTTTSIADLISKDSDGNDSTTATTAKTTIYYEYYDSDGTQCTAEDPSACTDHAYTVEFNCIRLTKNEENSAVLYVKDDGTVTGSTTTNDDYSLACIIMADSPSYTYTDSKGNETSYSASENYINFLTYLNQNVTNINKDLEIGTRIDSLNLYTETNLVCFIYFPKTKRTLKLSGSSETSYSLTSEVVNFPTTTAYAFTKATADSGKSNEGADTYKKEVSNLADDYNSEAFPTISSAEDTTYTLSAFIYQYRSAKKARAWFMDGKDPISLKVNSDGIAVSKDIKGQNLYYEQVPEVSLTVTYSDNTTAVFDNITMYGVDITKTVTATAETTTTTTGYYYDSENDLVKYATYTLTLTSGTVVKTTYTYRFWYKTANSSEKKTYVDNVIQAVCGSTTIMVSDIASALKTAESLTSDLGDPTNCTWTINNDDYAPVWTAATASDQTYISYVPEATEDNLKAQTAYINSYVQYTGETGVAEYYNLSTTAIYSSTYEKDSLYLMGVSGGSLTWTAGAGTAGASDESMDGILATANSHFTDLHYGEYYGMYYAYGGASDGKYTSGTIYRIMPNSENSAFVYITANVENGEAKSGYYYFTNTITYGDATFNAGEVWQLTFSADGSLSATSIKAMGVENGISDSVAHTGAAGYGTGTDVTSSLTNYSYTSDTEKFGYNYFILTNVSYSDYAMFASGGNNNDLRKVALATGVTYNNTNWEYLTPCKVSFLTEADYKEITENSTAMSCTTVGVASVNDLVCSTLSYDEETKKWTISGTPTKYYLYFPHLGRYAGGTTDYYTSNSDKYQKITSSTTSSDAKAFYICKYEGNYMFYYADGTDYSTDASALTTIRMPRDLTPLLMMECFATDTTVNTANAWTISDDSIVYSSSARDIASSGKYTGVTEGTDQKSLSNTFTVTVTYTNSDGNETAVDYASTSSFYYTVTKALLEDSTATKYSKTVTAYSGGAVSTVTYAYTEIFAGYEEGTITYYINGEALASSGTVTYTDSSGNSQTITAAAIKSVSYTSSSLGTTVTIYTATEKAAVTATTYYEDEISTTTLYSPVSLISDGAQFTSDFGLDYGTFYDQTYASSDIMTNLANGSWGNGDDGSTDMVGKVFRLAAGDSNLQANNYVVTGGFYTVYYDTAQGTYSLKAIANIDYSFGNNANASTDSSGTTTNGLARFTNMRRLTALVKYYNWKSGENSDGNDAHTGTGGTYTVTVTAFLRTENTDSSGDAVTDSQGRTCYTDVERKYSVDVVG